MVKIKAVYDNGGKTFDRYTIYIDQVEATHNGHKMYACLGLSGNPTSPQGFSQWSYGMLGVHNGKKITLADLPKNVREHAMRRIWRY